MIKFVLLDEFCHICIIVFYVKHYLRRNILGFYNFQNVRASFFFFFAITKILREIFFFRSAKWCLDCDKYALRANGSFPHDECSAVGSGRSRIYDCFVESQCARARMYVARERTANLFGRARQKSSINANTATVRTLSVSST